MNVLLFVITVSLFVFYACLCCRSSSSSGSESVSGDDHFARSGRADGSSVTTANKVRRGLRLWLDVSV